MEKGELRCFDNIVLQPLPILEDSIILCHLTLCIPSGPSINLDWHHETEARDIEHNTSGSGGNVSVRRELQDLVGDRNPQQADGIGSCSKVGEKSKEILCVEFSAVKGPRSVHPSLDIFREDS